MDTWMDGWMDGWMHGWMDDVGLMVSLSRSLALPLLPIITLSAHPSISASVLF